MNKVIKDIAEQAVEATQLMMIMEYTTFESKLYEKFAELIAKECASLCSNPADAAAMLEHFGVEEQQVCQGWVCHKCGTDRTKAVCPKGHMAAATGDCPMSGVAL